MTSDIEYKCNNCGHEGLNTRAVPDVPELVRYSLSLDWQGDIITAYGMVKDPTGEYVRYDQAAAMLAAKDAELAQIKAQEPVGLTKAIEIIEASFDTWASKSHNKKWFKRIDGTPITNNLTVTIAEQVRLLYAAPVDQTAEIESLREALKASLTTMQRYSRMGYGDEVYMADLWASIRKAETALSGKEPS